MDSRAGYCSAVVVTKCSAMRATSTPSSVSFARVAVQVGGQFPAIKNGARRSVHRRSRRRECTVQCRVRCMQLTVPYIVLHPVTPPLYCTVQSTVPVIPFFSECTNVQNTLYRYDCTYIRGWESEDFSKSKFLIFATVFNIEGFWFLPLNSKKNK